MLVGFTLEDVVDVEEGKEEIVGVMAVVEVVEMPDEIEVNVEMATPVLEIEGVVDVVGVIDKILDEDILESVLGVFGGVTGNEEGVAKDGVL